MTQERAWAGRFGATTAAALDNINKSISFDIALWREDLAGSRAHARMLQACGLLTADDLAAILQGLATVEAEFEAGTFAVLPVDEDIHMAVERRLTDLIGEPGKRLHTARSRNDQVATDTRLYVKRAASALVAQLTRLIVMLAERAESEAETLLPAYTHLQRGMPSTLGHHLLAYAEMLARDVVRIEAAAASADVSPLGSGACAGTSLPIDREMTARALGFSAISANSLDAVSDRDFVADFLYAGAMLMLHLSRWGEEWVLWSTAEFGFLELDDRVTTGSSMMPNKKNPDGAELLRGKAGRTVGNLAGFLTTLKGLPFAYNKDLQEDKEPLFDTHRTLTVSLEVAAVMLDAATFRRDRMAASCTGQIDATDLCERLVLAGEPLRTAHHQTGRLVRMALELGCELRDLPLEAAREHCPKIAPETLAGLSMVGLVNARDVVGGPAPRRVREASRLLLQRWQPRLNEPT